MLKLKFSFRKSINITCLAIDLPCVTNKQKDFCEIEIEEKQLFNALKTMPNNITPGND